MKNPKKNAEEALLLEINQIFSEPEKVINALKSPEKRATPFVSKKEEKNEDLFLEINQNFFAQVINELSNEERDKPFVSEKATDQVINQLKSNDERSKKLLFEIDQLILEADKIDEVIYAQKFNEEHDKELVSEIKNCDKKPNGLLESDQLNLKTAKMDQVINELKELSSNPERYKAHISEITKASDNYKFTDESEPQFLTELSLELEKYEGKFTEEIEAEINKKFSKKYAKIYDIDGAIKRVIIVYKIQAEIDVLIKKAYEANAEIDVNFVKNLNLNENLMFNDHHLPIKNLAGLILERISIFQRNLKKDK